MINQKGKQHFQHRAKALYGASISRQLIAVVAKNLVHFLKHKR